MLIIPAIDIKDGRVVRLTQGRFDQETVYFEKPYQVAKRWRAEGASFLHVVDLDGAKGGSLKNKESIKKIIEAVDISIQVGGGIRTLETVEELILMGVSKVILGTTAVNDQLLVKKGVERFREQIVIGIDAVNGYVAIKGWQEKTKINAVDLALKIKEMGISEIIYTDILRDGTLNGPNREELINIAQKTKLKVVASGGISSLEDIKKIKDIEYLGIKGIIIGKALYAKKIDLKEAIKVAEE
ncbi:1-(5-phosphoribosyl)-5-[(5-phosphoribosylamino)methylideneamino]imidazole-4-carboxamide isomerase [bacterium]|nr:1-(5-phosphoribosyl)-5-[(5-phosphoribosylamino)methylideneamino]imidazole-4-carboxamide isomerase [bacterium]